MKKIISLFLRNYETDRLARNEITPGAEWVASGEGIATQKHDGTSCMASDGILYRRYDAKAFTIDKASGKKNEWDRKPPEGFEPAQDPDPVTGHWPGWVPVTDNPQDKWHVEAITNFGGPIPDGTYELCGPKLQGNPERLFAHILIRHGSNPIQAPRDFDGIKSYLATADMEGIVWHHPDGRMAKVKKKDFGLKR